MWQTFEVGVRGGVSTCSPNRCKLPKRGDPFSRWGRLSTEAHRHCEVYGIPSLLYLLEQPFVGRLRHKMANFSLARLVGINPAGKAQHFTRRDVLFRFPSTETLPSCMPIAGVVVRIQTLDHKPRAKDSRLLRVVATSFIQHKEGY